MKSYLLNKFENVMNDIKSFLAAQMPPEKTPSKGPPAKIQEPMRPRKNAPQRTMAKKKSITNKDKSMVNSQGIDSFKGSGYKGKGNVDSSKHTSNRKRR